MIVTVVCMVATIRQARSAQESSQAARSAMAAVQLVAVGERLKSAQEHIRDIAPEKKRPRGYKVGDPIDRIRREFDSALSALPKDGRGGVAREHLTKAQAELNDYESTFQAGPDPDKWRNLQSLVQDTISDLASNASHIGG